MRLAINATACVLLLAAANSPARADQYNWTGVHLGLSAGASIDDTRISPVSTSVAQPPYAFVDTTGAFVTPPGSTIIVPGTFPLAGRLSSGSGGTGFAGGGQVGRDWQFGSTVFGIEGDVQGLAGSSQNLSFTGPPAVLSNLGVVSSVTGSGSVQRDVQGSLRARLGYAWDRFLLYGSAGAALGNLQTHANYNYAFSLPATMPPAPGITNPTSASSSFSRNKLIGGPLLGAGIEYAVCDNVSVGLDYRHTFFGGYTLALGTTPTVTTPVVTAGSPISAHYRLDSDAVMLRVNWRLNN